MPPTPAAQCPGPSSARGTTGRSSLAPLTAGRTVAKRVGTVHTGSKTVQYCSYGILFIGIWYRVLTGGTVHRDPSL